MEITNKTLLQHIKETLKKYCNHGSRSDKKLYPIHGGIAKDIANKLLSLIPNIKIDIRTKGYGSNSEYKFDGFFYEKDIDITFIYKDIPIYMINVKVIQQNYGQNGINYYEGMIGETVNVQLTGMPLSQIFIIPEEIPYFSKDGVFKRWENHSEKAIQKYKKLGELGLSHDKIAEIVCPHSVLYFKYKVNDIETPTNNDHYKKMLLESNDIKESSMHVTENWGYIHYNDYPGYVDTVISKLIENIEKIDKENA
jgi:hypothetical protein